MTRRKIYPIASNWFPFVFDNIQNAKYPVYCVSTFASYLHSLHIQSAILSKIENGFPFHMLIFRLSIHFARNLPAGI